METRLGHGCVERKIWGWTMRLKFFGSNVRPARAAVRDAAPTLTEDAVQPVAVFAKKHTAKEHDDGLRIHSPAGQHIATFHGAHVATVQTDGALHIFRKPRVTKDMCEQLHAVNCRNAEFYRRRV
jgi:hypothetical protein